MQFYRAKSGRSLAVDTQTMQVVFHIGDHKTGSTSIQRALFERVWACESVKLAYPPFLSDAGLARALYMPSRRKDRLPLLAAKAEWLAGVDADVAVISAEQFSRVKPETLQKVIVRRLPGVIDSARFLAYVRPHVGSIVSHYTQRAKSGSSNHALQEYVKNTMEGEKFNYALRFETWRKIFGERLRVRPMVRGELFKGDVVYDFFNDVLGGADFTLSAVPSANESAEVYELAVLRRLQGHAKMKGDFNTNMRIVLGAAVAGRFAQNRGARDLGGRVRLHRELYDQVANRYQADAQRMDDEFFAGRPILATALASAAADTVPERQACDLDEVFDAQRLAPLDQAIDALVTLLVRSGNAWRSVNLEDRGVVQRQNPNRLDVKDPDVQRDAAEIEAAISEVVAAGLDLAIPKSAVELG